MPNTRVELPRDHWVEVRDPWEIRVSSGLSAATSGPRRDSASSDGERMKRDD